MRVRRILAPLALVAGLALAGGAMAEGDPGQVSPSPEAAAAPAPPADEEPGFVDLAGQDVKVSQHLGHIVVLNFWATWCGPCRAELPELHRARQEFAPKGVHFIAASANGRDDGPVVTALLQQLGVEIESWLWVTAKDMRHWGVGPGIPATVVLDERGVIRATFRGTVTQAQLSPVLTKLLAETDAGETASAAK